MEIRESVSLAPYTTFKIGGNADYFCVAENKEDVVSALDFAENKALPVLVLGGGSNMLVSDTGFRGIAVHVLNKGFEKVYEDENFIELKIASGEVWDEVVAKAVDNNWWGIENLSHIPGLMGAFAVQNVGAYGQEASQVVVQIFALNVETQEIQQISLSECKFSYRKSIFNAEAKGKYIILHTQIRLSKKPNPNLNYGDVKDYFSGMNIPHPSLRQIRQAIIEIRNKKFPYPKEARGGNAGSFFRGPLLSSETFLNLKEKIKASFGNDAFERLSKMEDKLKVPQGYKTPAAFILDLCGLKGKEYGGARVNPPQPAIVLNATGQATSSDVLGLYRFVQQAVGDKLGLKLEIEPELVGFEPREMHGIIN